MRRLHITKKTGFKVRDPNVPIVIRDDRGFLFYSTEDTVPRTLFFNLPEGCYFVDSGMFTEMNSPFVYTLLKLPPAQRWFYPNVGGFDIKVVSNPNKCSIDWKGRQILIDHSFRDKPWPEIDFIISHEIGHKYYPGQKSITDNAGEKAADMFAYNRMIKKGYNPLQIGYAQLDSLSGKQIDRKDLLITKIIGAYDKTRNNLRLF